MRLPSESELLDLWEAGAGRHPIDRTLLLCSWARPDLAADRYAELPLGVINAALLRMRERLFGPRVAAQVCCPQCGELLEIELRVGQLLEGAQPGDGRHDVAVAGFRFRVPDSRDLASIANEVDAEAAALRLLERCCTGRPASDAPPLAAILAEVETELEAADPLADLSLAVNCEACRHAWQAGLDAGALLWDELRRYARGLLGQVDALARTYGWTEREVLALSPQRRASYLEMIGA